MRSGHRKKKVRASKESDNNVYKDYVKRCKICQVKPATFLKWLELSRRLVLPGDVLK